MLWDGAMPPSLPFDPIEEAHRHWVARGWEQAADGMAAVTSVMRAQQLVLAGVDRILRPLGLSFARYEVLMLLMFSRRGSLPLSVVGSRLQVHPTSITSAVDRLEAQGLVRRSPHPRDRRAVLAEISDDGRALAEKASGLLNDQLFGDLSSELGLSEREAATLVELVRSMRRAAGDFA
jgi:DNA-binding MarR family transcriptional regulator